MTHSAAVEKLLEQYETYKQVQKQVSAIERQLAKAKLLGKDTGDISLKQQQLRSQLQQISDDMTFADPLVWMQYKYYAYQDEAQPITTLHDFRVHCSKPGYICTKRFEFLNAALAQRNLTDFNDTQKYSDSLELSALFDDATLMQLLSDPAFIKQWNEYEYFRSDDTVAKWQNYS